VEECGGEEAVKLGIDKEKKKKNGVYKCKKNGIPWPVKGGGHSEKGVGRRKMLGRSCIFKNTTILQVGTTFGTAK